MARSGVPGRPARIQRMLYWTTSGLDVTWLSLRLPIPLVHQGPGIAHRPGGEAAIDVAGEMKWSLELQDQ